VCVRGCAYPRTRNVSHTERKSVRSWVSIPTNTHSPPFCTHTCVMFVSWTYTYVYTYVYVHTYVCHIHHIHMYIHMCVMYICICLYMPIRLHTHMYMSVYDTTSPRLYVCRRHIHVCVWTGPISVYATTSPHPVCVDDTHDIMWRRTCI